MPQVSRNSGGSEWLWVWGGCFQVSGAFLGEKGHEMCLEGVFSEYG